MLSRISLVLSPKETRFQPNTLQCFLLFLSANPHSGFRRHVRVVSCGQVANDGSPSEQTGVRAVRRRSHTFYYYSITRSQASGNSRRPTLQALGRSPR